MVCERCGLENPDGFRYCGACGAAIAEPVASGVEQERKVVSAVFCDLVEFTTRAEDMDPEDVHVLLRAYYGGVRDAFERFGGTVAKFIGDAIHVLYGAPRAHEDDPERAVRGALAALAAVAELNAARPVLDLHVHIGITTGEVLITLGPDPDASGGLAWGDLLNTASRLETAAGPDAILVDEPTYRATRHVFDYAAVEPIHAKGKAEPVAVWQPLGLRSHHGDPASQPLVGRRPELALLLGILDGVCNSRTPQLVTVVGEPGIGKSRLLGELRRRTEVAPDPVAFRLGRSPPYPRRVPFWALGEIVKSQAGMLESDGAATATAKLRAAVRDLVPVTAEAIRIESHLRTLVGLGESAQTHSDQRGAAFAAWRHFLEALARRRPLVVVFEDIHWADDGLLDFIEHLVGWAREVPMLILASARPDLLRRRPHWGRHDLATALPLPPLSDAESRALVRSLAREAVLEEGVTEAIVHSASGNPLYSVEFIRMLADRGLLAPGDARGPLVSLAELPVPASIRGIIASRLDSLDAEDKALLQAGAVIGRVVWPGALVRITGLSRRTVARRLRTLEDREFLRSVSRSSIENEREYRFRHVLIRDVAYSEIPRRRRGDIHRRTAEWLESLSPDRAADRAEMLAHHYVQAYDLSRDSGGDTGDLAERARRALRDAGDRALALHAFPAADRLFRDALARWPADEGERPWLLFRLGLSIYYAETAGAADVLEQARDALLAAGDAATAAEAESFLAYLAHHGGDHERFSQLLDGAAARVRHLGPSRSKAEVLVDVANEASLAGEHERAIAAGAEAVEVARALGLPEHEARALSIIGISRGLTGDPSGRADLELSIVLAEKLGSHLSADCCGKLADLEAQLGDLPACFALQARAREHAERFGHAPFVRWLSAERVGEGYWTGAWDAAVSAGDEIIAEAEEGTPNFMSGYCRTVRGRIRLARGDRDGALDDAARSVDFARRDQSPQMLYPALAFAARAQLELNCLEAGASLAEELLVTWARRVDSYPASSWAVDLACALETLGRGVELAEVASTARARTRWLGAVLAFAARDFATAADEFAAIGSRPDEAFARLRAAHALLGAGRADAARRQLQGALTFHRKVGATPYVREAELLAETQTATTAGGSRVP